MTDSPSDELYLPSTQETDKENINCANHTAKFNSSNFYQKQIPTVIMELQEALDSNMKTTQTLKEQLEYVLERESNLQKDYDSLAASHDRINQQLEQSMLQQNEAKISFEGKLELTKEIQNDLQNKLSCSIKNVEELQRCLSKEKSSREEIEKKLQETQSEHRLTNEREIIYKKKLDELKAEIEKKTNEIKKEKEDHTRQERVIAMDSESKENEIKRLSMVIKTCQQQIKSLEDSLAGYKQNSQCFDEEREIMNSKISSLTSTNEQLVSIKKGISKDLEANAKRVQTLEQNIMQEKKQKEEAMALNEKYRVELTKLNADKQKMIEMESLCKSIQMQLSEVKETSESLRRDHATIENERTKAVQSLKESKNELDQCKTDNRKLQSMMKKKDAEADLLVAKAKESMEKEISEVSDELSQAKIKISKWEIEIQKIESTKKSHEEVKGKLELEINQWKEAFLELSTYALKTQHAKIAVCLNINEKYKSYNKIPSVAKVMQLCKDIVLGEDQSPESAAQLKEALRQEKQKYLEIYEKYHAEMIKRRQLHNIIQEMKGNIRVMCRVRPLLTHETKNLSMKEVSHPPITIPEDHIICLRNDEANRTLQYEFDKVFVPQTTQDEVYEEVSPLIISCLDGFNICVMVYGQTGSGKTFTMEGNSEFPGILIKTIGGLFNEISERKDSHKYNVSLTMAEIYNEQIRNLLDPKKTKLELKENTKGKVVIPGLTSFTITTPEDALDIINQGKKNRATGATNINEFSSRSHSIVKIKIVGINTELKQKIKGTINLIDLAGSERIAKSGSEGDRMKEALNINLSLTTLGKVLTALANHDSHIPYRDSKLTHMLKESLGGDAKTLVIVQVSPNPRDTNESNSTLGFGVRVAQVEKGATKPNVIKKKRSSSIAIN